MKALTFFALLVFSTLSFAEPANVIRLDNFCSGVIPGPNFSNDDTDILGFFEDASAHIVGRDAGGEIFPGSGKITCRGQHEVELSRSVAVRDLACTLYTEEGAFITEESITVASPSGEVMLNCNFKKGKAIFVPW